MSRFCFSLLSLLLVGCGRQAVSLSAGQFDAAAPGDSLYAVRIPVGTEYMGEYPVQVAGDRIVMHNLGVSEKKFSVYRFSGDSLKKEGEFLGYGREPYEKMIERVAFDPDTRSLTMLADYNRENRFCRVSLDPPENLYDVSTWEYRQLSFIGDCSLGEPCLIDRSSYLTMGHHTDSLNMFSLLDIDGGRVVPLDFSYPALPLGLSPMVQEVVWTGRIRKHPRKNRFVYNAQDFKYLFIFELEEGNHIRIIRYLYDKLPQVHATREQGHPYAFDDACEDGCNSIAVDDDHFISDIRRRPMGRSAMPPGPANRCRRSIPAGSMSMTGTVTLSADWYWICLSGRWWLSATDSSPHPSIPRQPKRSSSAILCIDLRSQVWPCAGSSSESGSCRIFLFSPRPSSASWQMTGGVKSVWNFSYLCGDINLRNGKLLSFYHYPVQPEPLCAGQTRPAHPYGSVARTPVRGLRALLPAVRGSADERELHLAMSFRCRDARALPQPYRRL